LHNLKGTASDQNKNSLTFTGFMLALNFKAFIISKTFIQFFCSQGQCPTKGHKQIEIINFQLLYL